MKLSIYNSIIHINGRISLLYNANSDSFVILTKDAEDDISKGIDYIKKYNEDLLHKLLKVKAIVDFDTNEVHNLQKRIKEVIEDESYFELHINPTLDCNFNCWYCYEDHIKGSKMSKETFEATKKFIHNTIANNDKLKHFHLSFFGGEPLLYFQRIALPLILFAKDLCEAHAIVFSSHFTTNGWLINKRMLDAIENVHVNFQITLDGNKEAHNHTRFLKNGVGSYEIICNNIKAIAAHKHEVCLRINYTLQNLDSIISIIDTFKDIPTGYKRYINVDFQRVWQDTNNESNNLGEKLSFLFKRFKESGFSVSYHKVQNNVLYPCYGDKRNNLLINYNGKIYSCTAREFNNDFCEGILTSNGNIEWINDSKEKRIASKFNREECHICKIAPICGGGCSQNALEIAKTSECLRGLNEEDKMKLILDRFEFMFINCNH